MVLAKRATLFEESVIRGMTRLCQQHQAINLAQGFPDWDPPREVLEAAKKAIDSGYNQYAITWGAPNFRQAIARKMKNVNGIECDPEEEITVTCGATEAMMAAMLAVIDPGDEVVVFEPFYENYGPGPRTKAIVLNTPNNPTGKVFTHEELSTIVGLCQEFDALTITDEIYEHILYGGRRHISIATLPGMRDRTITICGHSKSYSMTGWRLAYAVAAPAITAGIRKIHDFLTVGAAAPLQEAAAVALELPASYYTDLVALYDGKRRLLLDILRGAGFEAYDPEAAYYIMTDFSAFGFADDTEFAHYLVKEIGVAAVPGTSFFHHKELARTKIRFNFAKHDDVLREAGARLRKLRRA